MWFDPFANHFLMMTAATALDNRPKPHAAVETPTASRRVRVARKHRKGQARKATR